MQIIRALCKQIISTQKATEWLQRKVKVFQSFSFLDWFLSFTQVSFQTAKLHMDLQKSACSTSSMTIVSLGTQPFAKSWKLFAMFSSAPNIPAQQQPPAKPQCKQQQQQQRNLNQKRQRLHSNCH